MVAIEVKRLDSSDRHRYPVAVAVKPGFSAGESEALGERVVLACVQAIKEIEAGASVEVVFVRAMRDIRSMFNGGEVYFTESAAIALNQLQDCVSNAKKTAYDEQTGWLMDYDGPTESDEDDPHWRNTRGGLAFRIVNSFKAINARDSVMAGDIMAVDRAQAMTPEQRVAKLFSCFLVRMAVFANYVDQDGFAAEIVVAAGVYLQAIQAIGDEVKERVLEAGQLLLSDNPIDLSIAYIQEVIARVGRQVSESGAVAVDSTQLPLIG